MAKDFDAVMIAEETLIGFNEVLKKTIESYQSKEFTIQVIPCNIGGSYSDGGFAVLFGALVIGNLRKE